MKKRWFSRDLLVEELCVTDFPLESKIVDQGRWTTTHEIVFEHEGTFWRTTYSVGSTEFQDSEPWEWDGEVECVEVERRKVEVDMWMPVEEPQPEADPAEAKTFTLTLPDPMAHAVMDALANNVVLQSERELFDFKNHFIDDAGTARAYATYQEVGNQLFEQDWGEEVTEEMRTQLASES